MPYKLDEIDTAILRSLFTDGRKSFRQISREIKVSTPTVTTRYQRLVSVGLIKGVYPTLDLGKLESRARSKLNHASRSDRDDKKLGISSKVKLSCDYCDGPVAGRPAMLRFASFERFFCCKSCRALYKEKYRSKMASISSSRHQ